MLLKSNSNVCVCEVVPVTDKSQEQVAGLGSRGTILHCFHLHWELGNVGSSNGSGVQFTFDSSNIFGTS